MSRLRPTERENTIMQTQLMTEEKRTGTLRQQLHRLHARYRKYYPFVGFLAGLVAVAVGVRLSVSGIGAAMQPYTYFFQLILAAAVLSLLRNEFGVKTFGLFAPAIIAFILLTVSPFWGIVLFLNIFVLALATYFALAPLQLGTAPRIATLLSVACLGTLSVLLLADADLLPHLFSTADVFFPSIISAWYADQFATEVEERGWTAPSIQFLWTLVAIFVAYLVISNQAIVTWFMSTPEAWVGLIVGIVLLGSQPTLRLNEYLRFSDHLGENPLDAAVTTLRVKLYNIQARVLGPPTEGPDTIKAVDILPKKLRKRYIETYNPAHLRPGADEKAITNKRLNGIGIGAPETYMVVDGLDDLDDATEFIRNHDDFVIKPSNGYGGEGIVVVSGRDEGVATDGGITAGVGTDDGATGGETIDETVPYDTSKGEQTHTELSNHVRQIVQGHYSGLDPEGTAVLEERLVPAEFLMDLCGQGVPDIRVIVFQGYPVMTMTRLPTVESEGAANLHQGGIGVGLRVADGTPIQAYQQSRDRWLEHHPDTGADLTDFTFPNWEGILETATRAAAASGLGYTGVDVVLDEDEIPRVLEVNVRPGLGIQNTTEAGLLRRLEQIEALPREYEFKSSAEKVELAMLWDAREWGDDR
jgi:alpha-L-glutamate ligase-like protein